MKDTKLLSINGIIYVDGIMIGTMGMNQRGLKMCSIKGDTIPHMTVLDELITGITTIQDGGTNEME